MFKKYFKFSAPIDLAKKLFETKDKKKNSEFVKEIKNRWSNLKDETEKMSKEEIKKMKNQMIYWKSSTRFLILIKRFKKKVQV